MVFFVSFGASRIIDTSIWNIGIYILHVFTIASTCTYFVSKNVYHFTSIGIFIKGQRLVIVLPIDKDGVDRIIEFRKAIVIICEQPVNTSTLSSDVAI
ncbi:MAG TPA: hypothetical protein VFR94_10590 [Nitrososphaeraceae archaeon]|nr:hypothetical protein [Nitrososphaeraceae archaeon]